MTAVATMTEKMVEPEMIALTAHDRCDSCGSQAYVQASQEGMDSELLFCMHHYNRNEHALAASGWNVIVDVAKTALDFRPSTVDA